ncbi:MAG: type 1 glutamine amidotransferase [Gemmatimonadota bacterium]|nr:type 1 glutamine amidotransferase [Gemmatimonadota bacterium]
MALERLLVFQHLDVEHPGLFREFFAEDGIRWDVVELDAGEPIPDLDPYDALWAMGGPMDVWEEDAYPWLVEEKAAIRHAVVEKRMPFVGICLGHQLLAAALGGDVGPNESPEVGVMDICLTPPGMASGFFTGFPETLPCLQWHSSAVKNVPRNLEVLASSELCAVQAMSMGNHAITAQFHIEITAETIAEWDAVPTYHEALLETLGADALDDFERAVTERLDVFRGYARAFYENWKREAFFLDP